MPKPVSEWDETYILSLPKEDNQIERKGSLKLDLIAGADQDDVLNELAKQLSAFANMGGGQVIYGLKNDGTADAGGVSTNVKNGTKEWLERRIPELTEYEILGFNVIEIGPKALGSQIQADKAAVRCGEMDWRYRGDRREALCAVGGRDAGPCAPDHGDGRRIRENRTANRLHDYYTATFKTWEGSVKEAENKTDTGDRVCIGYSVS